MGNIAIGNRKIGIDCPPFIVAEMSGNHNQSLKAALAIVDAAAKSGAHALKLQTYTADSITIDIKRREFLIDKKLDLWKGQSLYDLYEKASTPWEWHKPIFDRCRKLGLICFSSPFDEKAVDQLERMNVPAYKIASFENNHLPLIRRAASTGKPLIISTGMATIEEIDEAVRTARKAKCKDIILLKCTSAYPAAAEDANLLTIPHLRQRFGTEVGLSDHTVGCTVSIAGVALGATIIEKHFTVSRTKGGVDAAFSMEPAEMRLLIDETYKTWRALGKVRYGATKREEASARLRRSVYVVRDIRKNEVFSDANIRIIRPGNGLKPKHYDAVLGRKASRYIKKGTPVGWGLVR
ncbi:MAG: pseudaminic acid synthase [Candidatus Omnitrophota bacterium]|jgi:N-acetylneuraminate synthase